MTADYFENILFRYWLISKFEIVAFKSEISFWISVYTKTASYRDSYEMNTKLLYSSFPFFLYYITTEWMVTWIWPQYADWTSFWGLYL